MSTFFDSEIIKEELGEINKLQEEVYGKLVHFHMMDHDEQLDHISKLSELLDKQRIMYTRLSLSDDPEAKEMKNTLRKSLQGMGFPQGTDMPTVFSAMDDTIGKLKESVD